MQINLPKEQSKHIIQHSLSTQQKYCEGFFSSTNCNTYLLGIKLAATKVKKQFSHEGSNSLDAINAFDKAEVTNANLSQINAITVSSFCGPNGLIWGYDICKTQQQLNPWNIHPQDIHPKLDYIYDLNPLENAFEKLTGSVDLPRFPFLPGAHVPCAMKQITKEGPGHIYAALAIGIPEKRHNTACLLMEDTGTIPTNLNSSIFNTYKSNILHNLCHSIIAISNNLQVTYKQIFIGFKDIKMNKDEIGCALVCNPYFSLAQHAYPENKNLDELTLDSWENEINSLFYYKTKHLVI